MSHKRYLWHFGSLTNFLRAIIDLHEYESASHDSKDMFLSAEALGNLIGLEGLSVDGHGALAVPDRCPIGARSVPDQCPISARWFFPTESRFVKTGKREEEEEGFLFWKPGNAFLSKKTIGH